MLKKKNQSFSLKKLRKTFVLQQDQSDCGVACLLSLINFYGGISSLEKLRELSGTTRQGTTLLGLSQASEKTGFSVSGCEADLKSIIQHGEPLILHVVIDDSYQHYVVCYGFQDDYAVIGDPIDGIKLLNKSDLNIIWKSKACLILKPNSAFVDKVHSIAKKKKWFFRLLKKDIRLLAFSILLGLAIASLGMTMAIFSQKLIDEILPSKDEEKLIFGIALVAFLLLIRVLFTAIRDYFLVRQSRDFNNRIIDSFYSALLYLPKTFFDSRSTGELVARLNDTQRIQKVIGLLVSNLVINILIAIVSLFLMFYYSLTTGIIAFCSLPIYFVLIYSFNSRVVLAQKGVMQAYSLNESNYINSLNGIATIKNNNRQSIFKKINQKIYGFYQEKIFNLGLINIKLSLFSGIFNVLFLIGILTFTALQVYNEILQLGEFMALLTIAGSLLPSVASIALIMIPINEANVAFNRMFEFASIEKESLGFENLIYFESLKIENLFFSFPGQDHLLNDVNFEINKNECVGIVGESGSGKSTLGQILQKFYPYNNGNVTINNEFELRNIELVKWRNIIGVIPQEIIVFNGNIIDNILLGKRDEIKNVLQFCEDYGFTKYIQELPQQYDTLLGDGGINLSGGQKQILALMRALYKQPQILILDEFTSALDRRTEEFVLNLLIEVKKKMSIIFISHRLDSLKNVADKIYVIENNNSNVFGTHYELLETENFYSQFWNKLTN